MTQVPPSSTHSVHLLTLLTQVDKPSVARVWKALSLDDRAQALAAIVRDGRNRQSDARMQLLRHAAKTKKWRPQTVAQLSPEDIAAAALRGTPLPTQVMVEGLRLLHLNQRAPVLGAFLDCLGVPHEEGVVKDRAAFAKALADASGVRDAATALAAKFPIIHVVGYLAALRAVHESDIAGLRAWAEGDRREPTIHDGTIAAGRTRDLARMLAELRAECARLADELEVEAANLREGIVDIAQSEHRRSAITELVARLVRTADAAATDLEVARPDTWPDAASMTTLAGMTSGGLMRVRLRDIEAFTGALAERERRLVTERQAFESAERVLRIAAALAPSGVAAVPGLPNVVDRARSLLRDSDRGRVSPTFRGSAEHQATLAEIAKIGHADDPFAALVRLVTELNALGPEETLRNADAVGEAFGASVSLAAVRGWLVIREDELTPVVPRAGTSAPSAAAEPVAQAPQQPEAMVQHVDKSDEAPANAPDAATTSPQPPNATAPDEMTLDNGLVTAPAGDRDEAAREIQIQVETPPSTRPGDSSDAAASPVAARLLRGAWAALEDGLPEVALCLAQAASRETPDGADKLPAWLLEALALAPHCVDSVGGIAMRIAALIGSVDVDTFLAAPAERRPSYRLLLAAATLRPAVIAPVTGAGGILSSLRFDHGFEELWHLGQDLAQFSRTGTPLTIEALRIAAAQERWEDQIAQHRDEVRTWLEQRAPSSTTNYHRATNVWRDWVSRDGLISAMLAPIVRGELRNVAAIEKAAAVFEDPVAVRRVVQDTDRRLLERRKGENIQARALSQLENQVAEAVDLARRWIALVSLDPTRHASRLAQVDQLRSNALARRRAVQAELAAVHGDVTGAAADSRLRAAASACARAVDDLCRLLDGGTSVASAAEPGPAEVLMVPLLRFPKLRVGPRGVEGEPEDITRAVLDELDRPRPLDVAAAIDARVTGGDFAGAKRLLSSVADADTMGESWHALGARYDQLLTATRDAVRHEVETMVDAIETGLMLGYVDEDARNAEVRRASALLDELDHAVDLAPIRAALADIQGAITRRRDTEVEAVRDRARALGAVIPTDARAEIEERLAQGDVLTGSEYLERVATNTAILPADRAVRPVVAAFVEAIGRLTALGDDSKWLAGLEGGTLCEGVGDGEPLSPTSLKQAKELLSRWFARRAQPRHIDAGFLRATLEFLGFALQNTPEAIESPGKFRVWEFWAQPIGNPAVCPIPYYGSEAKGHYRVAWVWGEQGASQLVNELGNVAESSPPLIVLYFGRLSEVQRRILRQQCRTNGRRMLVLDDFAMGFLAAYRGERLPAFFSLTLPFTHLPAFHTRAGATPPELFVGRQRERESLLDPAGACFVYGGRQLGKTALLREVQRTLHAPHQGRVAVYLDLYVERIGGDRPPEKLWAALEAKLRHENVLASRGALAGDPERVAQAIASWLRGGSGNRRLLCLLDEADRFLEEDARAGPLPFAQASRLKGLMDETERRFKVVFAGLHNVQRTTRLANHPLAHLGAPICVGPLLGREWRSAADLITRPLLALGYTLDPPLVTRILSHTNYYPNLVQLYGEELLDHVSRSGLAAADLRCPPTPITDTSVREAYQSQQLRQQIRQRFEWTLQLDARYHVLALVLAHLTAEGVIEVTGGVDEVPVALIRRAALAWWAEGFAEDSTEDSFRALLDEMVGLGLLRGGAKGYAFRSPNVAILVGGDEEVQRKLVELEPPENFRPFAPEVQRRSLDEAVGTTDHRRSPLTVAQERLIASSRSGVHIVVGAPAAGLEDLPAALRSLASAGDDAPHLRVVTGTDPAELTETVEGLRRKKGIVRAICLVTAPSSWNSAWVHAAVTALRTNRRVETPVRVVLAASPELWWNVLSDWPTALEDLERLEVPTSGLAPWHTAAVRQWIEDMRRVGTVLDVPLDRLHVLTGFWSEHLYDRARQLKGAKGLTRVKDAEAAFEAEAARSRPWFSRLGLDVPGPRPTLDALRDADGEFREEELAALLEREPVRAALAWADALSLAHPAEGGVWRLDPFAKRLLDARR